MTAALADGLCRITGALFVAGALAFGAAATAAPAPAGPTPGRHARDIDTGLGARLTATPRHVICGAGGIRPATLQAARLRGKKARPVNRGGT